MSALPWIILFLPLVAAIGILFFGRYSRHLSAGLAIGSAAVGAILSWVVFVQPGEFQAAAIPWIVIPGEINFVIGLTIDHLSKFMLVLVTTIATIVFVYSLGYMAKEEGYWRYFAGLALFLFSMLGIVLADNLIMMFIFWELVGVSSYILIGHYFGKDSAADASKQAFLVNRIGDFGFMLGILMLWLALDTVVFAEIIPQAKDFAAAFPVWFTAACILIFCGTIGKSAQLPLHVWLPNSMEGPTPVSSLLHAATMVAAGVYMLARLFPVLVAAPIAMDVIAWVGGLTCFVAALMATQQDDIKRVLAYSTISQLGYMVLGIGTAPSADVAMFHLFTHACFKCLLFLCAGSVIVGMHHEQNIWKMGALKNKMPVTFLCFIAGMLALSGCPFTSGYFSKDLIIEFAVIKIPFLGWLSALAAGLTAFYMFREFGAVFWGPPRSEAAKHAHESPKVMTVPLVLLSLPALFAGWPIIQNIFFHVPHPDEKLIPGLLHPFLLVMFFGGGGLAWMLYRNVQKDPISIPLFANRLYIDDFYALIVRYCQDGLAAVSALFDRWVVDVLIVQIPSKLTWAAGFVLRFLQLGNIQAYAFFFGAGVVGLLYFLIAR